MLREYCSPEAILCNMEAADKEDAIHQLVDVLLAAKRIPSKPKAAKILKEIVERERQATTGIGKGVGIPHARSKNASALSLAIGRIPRGLDYGAVDGERVRVILLLVSPDGSTDEHLAAMKTLVSIVRDPYQCKRLHGCATAQSFLDLLAELDK
jgi:mannitol/fructose-specific phosphotransferase system IIA component (Ntr-type)